jgi:Na+-transporting NADH:ubiquinone oxidoreductase subunit C
MLNGGLPVASFDKDSLANTFVVALALCLVCSVIVSSLAVALKPIQQANKELDIRQNILRAAGMLPSDSNQSEDGRSVEELFAEFTVRAVDLDTGRYRDDVDVATFDPIRSAKDPDGSVELTPEQDVATLRRRENTSLVYIKRNEDGIDKVVIPVRGYGLWGTLYGYLALEGDLQTIAGLGFYQHKETPGLGGEVDNARWKASWNGVKLYGSTGEPAVSLVKTRSADSSTAAAFEVDALSGATFTTKGVESLINFWTGDLGFGPYIERLKSGGDVAQG